MASQTWAQRAKTAALDDSTPPPAPARQTPQSNAPPQISKASSSDNWRAGSSRGVPSTGGWIKEEKKEKKGRRPSLSATPRESSQRRHHQSSSGTTTQAKSASPSAAASTSTSWAAADPTDALPSPTFAPVALPADSSNPTGTSDTPTAANDSNFPASTPSDSNSSTQPSSGTGLSEAPSTSTPAPVDSLPPPPPKEKLPAPLPKVNVWSVRKDQLAAAAPTAPAVVSSPTVPAAAAAAPHKEKRSVKDNSHSNPNNASTKGSTSKKNASNSAKSSASSSATPAPTPSSASTPTPSPLAATLDPLPTTGRKGSAPSPAPRRGDGWSGLRELATGAAPVGDRESWPAPNEEVPVVKEKSKKAKAAAAKLEHGADEPAPKKKSDKTKWIAIKVDIRHAGTSTARTAPAGEKRVKAPRRDGTAEAPKAGAAAETTTAGAGEVKATVTKASNGAPAAAGPATTTPLVANGKKSTPSTRPSPPTGPSTDSRRPLPADFPQKPSTSTLPTSLANPSLPFVPTPINGSNAAPGAVLRPFSNRTPNAPGASSSPSEPRPSGPTPSNNPSKRTDLVDPTAATPTQPARDFGPNAFRGAAPRGGRGGSVRGRGVNNRAAYPVRAHVVPGAGPFHEYGAPNGVDPVVPYASYTPDLAAAAFYPSQIGAPVFPAQSAATPLLDPYTLDPTRYWLLGQLEWYMSVDNLCRDMFLRTKMDDQGWIEISVIANFNRIKNLTSDHAIVRETMGLTPILEVFGDYVRVRQNWPEWVLPNALPSRVDAKDAAAAALGGEQPASPGKDVDEGAASHGHSSEDDEEGTAPTTVSTGSQAGEDTPVQKVVELEPVATEPAVVTAA